MKQKEPNLTFSHPTAGALDIGEEKQDNVLRKHHVQLSGGSGAALHIYKDGGWGLFAAPNDKGSTLLQEGKGPIAIQAEGDILIDAGGDLTLRGKNITMETTDQDGDIVLNAIHNIRLDADNNVTVLGTNVTTKATSTLLNSADGWVINSGSTNFLLDQKTKLIPDGLSDLVNTLLGELVL